MNFLRVLWSDICNIFRNRYIRVSVIAIIMIPLIYGGLYLAAFWDPYGKTENLPVAVVNLDTGGVVDKDKVNYGQDIVDKLKNNSDLKWQFVKTEKEAEKGLEGNKYYAMIVIPKDFSQRLADADKGKLQKPKLIFVANKKKNYIVGLITDKAAKALSEDVSKGIMDNFTDQVFDNLYDIRDGMETAADGTSQIKDGVTDLKDSVPALADGVNKLYDGSSSLNDKLHDAGDGSNKLRDGLGTLNGKMPDLVDGVNKLYKGSSTLNKKIGDALDGSKQLRDGMTSLYDKMPDLTDGTNQIYDGSTSLKESLGELNDNMPDLIDGVDKLRDGANDLRGGLSTAKESAKGLYTKDENGNVIQDTGLPALKNGADKMQSQIPEGIMKNLNLPDPSDPSGKTSSLQVICGALDQIYGGMQQLNPAVEGGMLPISSTSKSNWEEDFNTIGNLDRLFKEVAITSDTSTRNNDLLQIATILNGTNPDAPSSKLAKTASDLNTMASEIENSDYYKQAIGIIQSTGNVNALPDQLKQLVGAHDALKQLSAGASTLDTKLAQLKQTLALYQGAYSISDGLGKASAGVGSLVDGLQQLYDGSDKLYNGLDDLYDQSKKLQDGVQTMYDGSQNLRDGIDKFKGTVPDLTNGIGTLSDGSRDLSDGLFKINEGSQTLTDKLGELNQKVPDIQQGVQDLYDGSTDLSDGLLKLGDGSQKIKDGIKSLKDKIPDMQDGVDKLYEGIAQLNDSLKDGAEKLSDKLVASSKSMGKFMSDPIKLQDKPLYEVSTYGEGLSPYFISLALWVGALMMFFVITERVDGDIKVGPVSIVLGKYLSYVSVGILQALLISFTVIKLGLRPSNVPVYYLFNIFLSFVFIAIIQNFIFLFEDAGRLFAVIALVLQLTSSNGTFPAELLPKFFKTIGPYLPFTYSISAIREINSGIDHAVLIKDVTVLSAYMLVFLTFSVLLKHHSDTIKAKFKASNGEVEMKEIESGEGEIEQNDIQANMGKR